MGAIETRDFAWALRQLKEGNRVARTGWNGAEMFLFLVAGSTFKVNRPPLLGIYPEGTEINYHAHIDMKTAQGYVVPWLASQADMLAEDWVLVVDMPKVKLLEECSDAVSAVTNETGDILGYKELDLAEFPIVDEPEPREVGGHDIDVDGPPEFR